MPTQENFCSKEHFNQLLGCLFDAAWNPQEWPIFLKNFGRIVGSVCTTLYYQDSESQKGSLSVAMELESEQQRFYAPFSHRKAHRKDVFSEDASLSGYIIRPGQIVVKTEFYEDWLLGGLIIRQDAIKANLVCLRPGSAGPFGKTEQTLIEQLIPYLRRAMLLHRRVRSIQVTQDATSQLFNHLTMGVVLVDCKARLLSFNRYAQAILTKNDGLSIVENNLRTSRRDESKKLLKIIQSVAPCEIQTEKLPVHAIRISRPSGREPYSILASPLTTDLQLAENECIVALFIHDPEEELQTSEQTLRELYGLTPAEARLVSLLLKGKTLEEAAGIAETSMSTVRTQIRSVFAKTNTNRQADLIRLLLRSPVLQKH